MLSQLFDVTFMFYEDIDGTVKYAVHTKSYDGTSEKDIKRYARIVMDDWVKQINEKRGVL